MSEPLALTRTPAYEARLKKRYAAERRTGGLGMHLMEKIMDSVTFRRSARRNVCVLVKRKDAAAAP